MVSATTKRLERPALEALLQELALEASQERFAVAPNPVVGAAVLSGLDVIGRGVHERWGQAHAEVGALSQARESGVDPEYWDTLVVTLEPCSSTGKTPPCTQLILDSGIQRVVVGALDPDPRHRGQGLELLRSHGLEVELLYSTPIEQATPHFAEWNHPDRLRRARPWTIAKWAQTRTGQLSPPSDIGEGRWISSEASLSEVQDLRAGVDAIVTGVGTILADNPRLTVRGDARQKVVQSGQGPVRLILDSYLRTPPEARIFHPASEDELPSPVVVVGLAGSDGSRHRALVDAGAHVLGLHVDRSDHVDLWGFQHWMWDQGLRRILLECGPTLLDRHFGLDFVDQVCVYTGAVNGGKGPSLGPTLAELRLQQRRDRESGPDGVLEAFVDHRRR